jgi:hypothetical protein
MSASAADPGLTSTHPKASPTTPRLPIIATITKQSRQRQKNTKNSRTAIQKRPRPALGEKSKSAKKRSSGRPKDSRLSLESWKTVKHRANLLHIFTQCAKFTRKDLPYILFGTDHTNEAPILEGLNRIARKNAKRVIFPKDSGIAMRNALQERKVNLREMNEVTRVKWIRENV